MNRTAMNNSVMPNRYIISDYSRMFLIGTMDDSTILYVYFVPNFNIVNVSPKYSVKPYTTIFTKCYITNNSGIFGNITITWNLGFFSVYSFYYRHFNRIRIHIKKMYRILRDKYFNGQQDSYNPIFLFYRIGSIL